MAYIKQWSCAISIPCSVILLSVLVQFVGSRSFPATVSRSFRFPDVGNDDGWDSIKHVNIVEKYAHDDRINIPASSGIPRSNSRVSSVAKEDSPKDFSDHLDSSSQESLSSEVIEAGLGENEENHHSGKVQSEDAELRKALCPPTNGSNEDVNYSSKIRYDLQNGKCGITGTKAHCQDNMIFKIDPDSSAYGFCDCITSLVPFVYHLGRCHPLFDKAYCAEGEWLVVSRFRKELVCEPKMCPTYASSPSDDEFSKVTTKLGMRRKSKLLTPSLWTSSSPNSKETLPRSPTVSTNNEKNGQWVLFNGTDQCVQLFSSDLCEPGEQIMFRPGSILAKCWKPGREAEARAFIERPCPVGSFYSIIGRCQPDWDF